MAEPQHRPAKRPRKEEEEEGQQAAAARGSATVADEAVDPAVLSLVAEAEPTIPDEVVQFYLLKNGCQCPDPRVRKLIALATQKFIFDVATDAKEFADHRGEKQSKKGTSVLRMEDLARSLEQHGVNVVKPAYFADEPL